MHKVIRIIVYANRKEEALGKGRDTLDFLCGEDKQFDYGSLFNDEYAKSRWGNLPVVCLVDSKEGKKLIKDGIKFTKDEFFENLERVKNSIKTYSNEELFEEELIDTKKKILESLDNKQKDVNLILFRIYCSSLDRETWIFDEYGEGIRNEGMLKSVLDKWGKKDERKVWVVPADVHY